MLQARPLYDNEPDARFFVPPVAWDSILRAVDREFNTAIVGTRGGGRTTALRQLQRHIRSSGRQCAYVDATSVTDAAELVERISAEITGPRGVVRNFGADMALAKTVFAGGPPGTQSLRVIERIREWKQSPATVILIDCTQSAEAAYGLFGRLRDELWQLDHRWVVALEETERSILLAPPADAFFEQVVTLETDETSFLRQLLTTRAVDLPAETISEISERSTSPRAALQLARDVSVAPFETNPFTAYAWRQEGASELGRPHAMAMAELESLGGASASDQEFIERMGWTRSRASQVLGELANAGLLTVSDEQVQGSGRPRRIYRPAPMPKQTGGSS